MEKSQNLRNTLIKRYSNLIENSKDFATCINKPLKQSFRINTIKSKKKDVLQRLKEYDKNIKKVPWSKNAFVTDLTNLGSSIEHFSGLIYIQELTSMVPPLIINDLKHKKNVIDCCAAPGSKTTQIADIMQNKGHIIANDSRHSRIKALRGNLDRLGITNTTVSLRDFKSFPNTNADVYFVDAPCSSEGTIRKKNTIARPWKNKDYERFHKLQTGLLKKACEMAKRGNTIIYSTCTFAPEENEKVVSDIINEMPVKLKKIKLDGLKSSPGITKWEKKEFDSDVEKCMRIWPHQNDTGAFFIARMEKC